MILLDEEPPRVLEARGAPVVFRSHAETMEYAVLHGVERWMVYGDPDGWWPIYTQAGPERPLPLPKPRVDISLVRH